MNLSESCKLYWEHVKKGNMKAADQILKQVIENHEKGAK